MNRYRIGAVILVLALGVGGAMPAGAQGPPTRSESGSLAKAVRQAIAAPFIWLNSALDRLRLPSDGSGVPETTETGECGPEIDPIGSPSCTASDAGPEIDPIG